MLWIFRVEKRSIRPNQAVSALDRTDFFTTDKDKI